MKRRAVFWIVFGLGAALSIYSLMPVIGPVKVIRDVEYIDGDSSKAHKLDFFMPQYRPFWDQSRPLVVWIHSGGWYMGDKTTTPAAVFPRFGFVSASVNYRLTDEAKFPAQLEDVKAAIQYLRRHSTEYGIDRDKIGVWGVSAGAQLAALVALNTEMGTPVQAVCDWCGPSDLVTITGQSRPGNRLELTDPKGPLARLLGGLPKDVPKMAKLASPVNFVHAGAPPFFIVHGDADSTVPFQQSSEFAQRLTDCGVPNKLHVLPGGEHDFMTADLIMEAVNFFEQTLKNRTFSKP